MTEKAGTPRTFYRNKESVVALEDPEIQKGMVATILALCGAVLWWAKRRIGLVDDLDIRVSNIEKDYVTKTYLDEKINGLNSNISKVHGRVDEIYRDMPKRKQDEAF